METKNNLGLRAYELNDYITKVVKQAYEGITGKVYSSDTVHILMFIIDDCVYLTWRITEYSPMAYKIPVKIRYRLRNNFNKHFIGTFNIFTRHTIESENVNNEESINYKIINSKSIFTYGKINEEFAKEALGKELYEEFIKKIVEV